MSNTQKTKTTKTQQSIARSLNLSFFVTLFSFFLSINILIIMLFSYFSLLEIETQLHLYTQQVTIIHNQVISPVVSDEITVEIKPQQNSTFLLNQILRSSTLENVVSRRLEFDHLFSFSLFNKFDDVTYHVQLNIQNETVTLSYDMNSKVQSFVAIYRWVLVLQVISLLSAIIKQSQKTKTALHPLKRLSTTTKNIQQDIGNLAVSVNNQQLKSIASAIEKIDAEKLDRQLQVSSSQSEFVELTEAINDMLIRVNQAVALQTQFVSDASHELRTPISVIQGYIHLLDRWGKDDPNTLAESIEAIKNETENMKTLVEHLLFLARGDSDNIQLVLENIDISKLLDEIIKETSFIDEKRKFELQCSPHVFLVADRQLLKQALRILLDNALKYSTPSTPIIIRCAIEAEHFVCSITDQGIGISPENIERIFDRFYRDEQARVTKAKGSGLGLSIAKWIIEKHQGNIEVISRQNIGTKVLIHLPISKESNHED